MALFQLDDVFTYQDANDIKKLWAGAAAPANPGDGEVWLDISATPYKLKRYNPDTCSWETIAGMTDYELLEAIKNADGSGSGLDADLLDGQEGDFYRDASNLNAGTVARARLGALWRDNNNDVVASPYIQSGWLFTVESGTTVVFDEAFTLTPLIYATPENSTVSAGCATMTTTYFKVKLSKFSGELSSGYYHWLAIGQKL